MTNSQDAEQQFHSREKGSNPPQLVVRFRVATPETTITSGPAGSTIDTSATHVFSSDEPGSTFECRIDSQDPAAFQPCTSPLTHTGLLPGSHVFEVRAVNATGIVDPTPASSAWTITAPVADTTPPDTTMGSAPPATTASPSATFAFSANEVGSTFQCALDAAAFGPCASPANLTGLAVGVHSFQVRAIDVAGNIDATPASHSWTIQAAPPNCGSPSTLTATADSWIDEGSSSSNKGTDATLKVMSKSGGNIRALVTFALPQVPQGCVLDTATLRLYAASVKDSRTLQALRVGGEWSETGVSWSNQPATAGTAATVGSGSVAGWREWGVTEQVQAMLAGVNYGFLIRDAAERQDAEQQFNSREKGSDMPQLVITFRPAS